MRQTERQPSLPASAVKPGMVTAMMAAAALTGVLVLAQAALAGQFLRVDNTNGDLQKIHGYIGNAVFLFAIAQAALIVVSGLTGRLRSGLLSMAITLVVLTTAQLGLGYSGRDRDGIAAALHIPLGVLIFGIAMANISMAMRAQREG